MASYVHFQLIILIVYLVEQHLCVPPIPTRSFSTDEEDPATLNSFDELNNVDKWSVTKFHVGKSSFRWTIINLSFNGKEKGEYIESPAFSDDSDSDYKWRLKLYPNGYEKPYVSTRQPPTSTTGMPTTTTTTKRSRTRIYYNDWSDYSNDSPMNPESNDDTYMALHLSLASQSNPVFITSKISLLNSKNELISPQKSNIGTISNTDELKFDESNDFIKRESVMGNNALPDDTLTIVVEITRKIGETNFTGNCGSSSDTSSNSNADNFETLLEDEIYTDVSFKIKNYEIKAHRAILASVSSVLLETFKNLEKSNGTTLEIENVEPKVFKEMLRFAYSGKVEKIEKHARKLLPLAQQYNITQLKNICERALCHELNSDNAIDLLTLATDTNASYLKLQALKYITTHTQNMIDTPSFASIISDPKNLINMMQALKKESTAKQ